MLRSGLHSFARTVALLLGVAGLLSVAPAAAAPPPVVFGVHAQDVAQQPGPVLDRIARGSGAMPRIAMYFRDWEEGWRNALIDPPVLDAIAARGAIPMITWEPFLSAAGSLAQPTYTPRAIAAGSHDAHVVRAAHEAAAYGRPLFIRFAHEMNGDWSPWGALPGSTPADYVAMWRRVVGLFRAAGAANVRWVWSPNVPDAGVRPFAPYFPGDGWVDAVGLDGYNWGPAKDSPWRSFAQVFGAGYDALTRLTAEPVLITETASGEAGGDKPAWIAGIAPALARRMPRVRALIWFDRDKETRWSAGSSAPSLRAFRRLVRSPQLGGDPRTLLARPSAARAHRARSAAAARIPRS